MEGLHLKKISEEEALSGLALELRYTLNAKTVKASKLSKKQSREKVRQAFRTSQSTSKESDFASRIQKLNQYFAHR